MNPSYHEGAAAGKSQLQSQFLGGANGSGASFDPATGWLYVKANELPRLLRLAATDTPGRPDSEKGEARILDHEGDPSVKPPWGTLTVIDLNGGDISWRERSPSGTKGVNEKPAAAGDEEFYCYALRGTFATDSSVDGLGVYLRSLLA